MDVTIDQIKAIGSYMIFFGILMIVSSFVSFAIEYSIILSDILLAVGFPCLLLGTLAFSFSEGRIPNNILGGD